MPLPPQIGNLLAGLWRIESRESALDHCYGLEVYGDSRRGQGYFVNLVHWKPGRAGCDSSSSELGRVELTATQPNRGDEVRLTGLIPRNVPDRWTDVQLVVSTSDANLVLDETKPRWANGTLTAEGTTHNVVLRATDYFPQLDLLPEPA